ncbi:MAG: CvpA family protein [Acidibrevibacterium sp.]|jgi:membrane protein required for colicin V production|uniref:CvpA family protein n=1 Tax=Acidibrevibacterium fodinaquatile TaxID=1969806 RepID=UPI0023A888E5|nr:CvpA family protein [Acidibrevibacterium fodinaquatile]MCA7117895.1 CvpA family protein [Acidibrevibacterium fodinaquatile]
MTWVDLAALGVVAVSALLAFGRGFVREALGIGAWVGAAVLATHYFELARPHVREWIPDIGIADPVAFALVFLAGLIVFSLIAGTLARVVRTSLLGGLDRTLGLVFGIVRGFALLVVAYIIGGMLLPPERWPSPVLAARSLPYISRGAQWAIGELPAEFRPRLALPPAQHALGIEDLLRAAPAGYALGARAARAAEETGSR